MLARELILDLGFLTGAMIKNPGRQYAGIADRASADGKMQRRFTAEEVRSLVAKLRLRKRSHEQLSGLEQGALDSRDRPKKNQKVAGILKTPTQQRGRKRPSSSITSTTEQT